MKGLLASNVEYRFFHRDLLMGRPFSEIVLVRFFAVVFCVDSE